MKLRHKNILLFALALCIVFLTTTAETLIASDLLHFHIGPDCHPCLRIEIMQCFLNALKLAGIALFAIGSLVFYVKVIQKKIKINTCTLSPIMLKVRINC